MEEIGASRLSLPEFFYIGDRVNNAGIARLLDSMKRQSRPVKPKDLGIIGRDHLAARFKAADRQIRSSMKLLHAGRVREQVS